MKKIYINIQMLFFTFLTALLLSFSAKATIYPFTSSFSGLQEVPANASTGKGVIAGWYNDVTKTISFSIIFGNLTAPSTAGHFHAPGPPGVNASVIIGYTGFPTGVMQGSYSNSFVITPLQESQLFAGLWYSNIHSTAFPGGEIRSQITLGNPATLYIINNTYSGSQEVPPNGSMATGRIIGSYDAVSKAITYGVIFSGLSAPAAAAHFHAPAPSGVNASVIISFPGFPAAITGTYFNSNILNPVQQTWLLSNLFYANIHNSSFPGGEIRAQITPNIPAGITCPANIIAVNDPGQCSRSIHFADATATGNPAPTVTYKIGSTVIGTTYTFPVGTTTVTATATNAAGVASCTFTVTVNDTEAPVISAISATPDHLWPPNHKFRDVTVNYSSSDNCSGAINCGLSVTSNEEVGGKAPDWIVIDDHHVMLRAERNGNGDGRIYTITATCTDAHGNSSSRSTTVTVAHDQGKSAANNTVAINDMNIKVEQLSMKAYPNPAMNDFILDIQSASLNKISIRVTDLLGRVLEVKDNITGNQQLRIGSQLKAGIYFVRLTQGAETKQLKLVKMK
jgi:hypothetical protein